ncbi:MAG: hypothetical protein JO135_02215 [Candidatus Eremiobacteraeota bacterium]|nr:hypothetical protein [Candidatus Eremiobacteraeota bacterium]
MRAQVVVFGALILTFAACAQHQETSQARISPAVWPTPRVTSNDAPPEILAIDLAPSHVGAGAWWTGRIATSTNVASVEVRWPFLAFNVPRVAPGQFAFRFHALDLPIIYRRPYTVEILARNTPGAMTQRNIVIDFR